MEIISLGAPMDQPGHFLPQFLRIYLPSTIEELSMEPNRILSKLNLALPSLQFISTHGTGV